MVFESSIVGSTLKENVSRASAMNFDIINIRKILIFQLWRPRKSLWQTAFCSQLLDVKPISKVATNLKISSCLKISNTFTLFLSWVSTSPGAICFNNKAKHFGLLWRVVKCNGVISSKSFCIQFPLRASRSFMKR